MKKYLSSEVARLPGPILVLGASGFIGANLFRCISAERDDVYGTSSKPFPWRLKECDDNYIKVVDLLMDFEVDNLLESLKPKIVFNCLAYGAYSFQRNTELIYRTNFSLVVNLLERLSNFDIACFINAGTSSEYGRQAASPLEGVELTPNSHYAVSKAAASGAIHYMGSEKGIPCANLRLYSAYGPMEDSSRLVPQLIIRGSEGGLPDFVDAIVSRDFVFVDDIVGAFLVTANRLSSDYYGQSFNIGTGKNTTIGEISELAQRFFDIKKKPIFNMPNRDWDVSDWYSNSEKANAVLGWQYQTEFEDGLRKTSNWYTNLTKEEKRTYIDSTKQNIEADSQFSISTVVACYNDEQAIPVMYERLTACLAKINIDYEIIFVNDSSPDNSEEVIVQLSEKDHRVIGISHSRNFGSQASFRSGMEIATKNAVVLMDGDLQDPPEMIEQFVIKWRDGYDVVYGKRVKREAPWYMQLAYKAFYRLFDLLSYIHIPHDAGEFSLLDIKVVRHLLTFPERDMFFRGLRAFVGFKQVGIDYTRPERMFGRSTNSLFRNLNWAKKGLFSFSYTPLNILTTFSFGLFFVILVLVVFQVASKLLFPESAPRGITTLLLVNLGFGSLILLAVSLLGEYIARIFEEVKRRPRFIRRSILRNGELRKL